MGRVRAMDELTAGNREDPELWTEIGIIEKADNALEDSILRCRLLD
jgi:hypothetical protein